MFKAYFPISISISAVILLIIALRPVLNRQFTAKCRYAVWIITVVMLIIPFKPNFPHRIELDISVGNIPARTEAAYMSETRVQKLDLPVQQEKTANTGIIADTIYLTGAAVFMLYNIIGYALFCRKIKPFCTEIEGCKSRPRIMRCKVIKSPILTGFFKPRILLPEGLADIDFALKHELVHYKRGDLWINLLFITANALHWFNPAVYLMRFAAKRDMEYSCDEAVIKNFDTDMKKAYSLSILHCASDIETTLATCFRPDKENLRQRISNILSSNHRRNGAAVFIAAAICLLLCTGLVGCADKPSADARVNILSGQSVPVIWFDEGSNEAYDTVKKVYKPVSILYNGEEQLETPDKSIVFYNERLGLFHACIRAVTIGNISVSVQPYGTPKNPGDVPYSDIIRNENGYYGQFVYNACENSSGRKRVKYEPFYAQVTFDGSGYITLHSDDGKYIIRLFETE